MHAHVLVSGISRLVSGQEGAAAEEAEQRRGFGAESSALNAERFRSDWLEPLTSLPARLAIMDSSGVDTQAISISPTQYHYWADTALSREIVDAANAGLAALAAQAPDRLVALATVALQHPDLAAEQLRHAMTTSGMRGVQIGTIAGGKDFSDPAYDVFWAAAAELSALVFVHPWGCGLAGRLSKFYLGNVVGQPTETTVALSHIVFGGVLDRHPDLRICAAHGGGYFPYYLGRADHAYHTRPECRTMARPPREYLRSLYFDSLVYDDATLNRLVEVAGADRVLLGSDYPFDMGVADPIGRLQCLPLAQRVAVAGSNAMELLALDAPVRHGN
ncbi:amidohydrolase family protein [Nocardia beijingensis]|uniref:amidohydrolase family protein n=1 Tax=Nocardia beijingensis TaxID=95162 RepID=UPI00331BBE92